MDSQRRIALLGGRMTVAEPRTPGTGETGIDQTWWQRRRRYSRAEVVSDALVHSLGMGIALGLGGLLIIAGVRTAPNDVTALSIYVASLVTVLAVSLAFNMAPASPLRRLLARLDQAAIFLLIAGTYTPILGLFAGTTIGQFMLIAIWGAAIVGVALKLIIPQHFGRLALVFYGGIGWSGLLIYHLLATTLPASTLWLLLAGGITYSCGIIFHVWDRLRFHNVLWHGFVVAGASLHLWAILDCMVLTRL